MARWTDLSADEIAAKSAANRAARKANVVWFLEKQATPQQYIKRLETPAEKPPKSRQKAPATRPAGKVIPKATRKPKMSEKAVLSGCKAILDAHPLIALSWRQNTGAVNVDGKRFVKFSFRGASDLMAVTVYGKFLACECKATGKKASPEQAAFLDNVLDAGGYAVCVDAPHKLHEYLQAIVGD